MGSSCQGSREGIIEIYKGTVDVYVASDFAHGLNGSRRQSGSYRQRGKTIDLIEKKPDSTLIFVNGRRKK